MESPSLLGAIEAHLARELGDRETAHTLAEALHEDALSWRAPEIDPARIDTIMAFTFGNRMLPNGNRAPGPVNEALADVAVRLHRQSAARIYAQWEVAEAIGSRVPQGQVTAIYPGRDERAEPVYLSTSGVVSAVVAMQADRRSLGVVGVVGFADHLWRCVTTVRQFGLDAYAPSGYAMPGEYDAQSGQPWCRNRLAYLMHDIMIRANERRGRLIEQSSC
jgi:beta-lactamase class A